MRKPDDTEALTRIHTVLGDLPTYGYRRVWALLRRLRITMKEIGE